MELKEIFVYNKYQIPSKLVSKFILDNVLFCLNLALSNAYYSCIFSTYIRKEMSNASKEQNIISNTPRGDWKLIEIDTLLLHRMRIF